MTLCQLTRIFTIGSLFGAFLAMAATSWLFGVHFPGVGLTKFALMVLGISLLAAYGIYFYLHLKERLQTAAVQLKERQVLAERLEKLKAAAELSALQSKIQPHFLFNTLNSIAALIREDPALVEATTEKLAELFRHVLDSNHFMLSKNYACSIIHTLRDLLRVPGILAVRVYE